MVMRNDPGAFRILYDEWAERIYAMAYDMLGDTILARSAAAECFCRAWKNAADLKDEGKLDEWLEGIARQTCSDAAFSRRKLSEADKEEVWKETAARAGISAREWENTGLYAMPSAEAEASEDWSPLIFIPDEDEREAPSAGAAGAKTAAAETQPPEAPAADQPPHKAGRGREHARKHGKSGALLAGSLAVIALVLLGGAVLFGLATTGVIRLPESLSGAADAILTMLGAFSG